MLINFDQQQERKMPGINGGAGEMSAKMFMDDNGEEMKYTIRELEAFSVIGQEIELTNYQKRNIQISMQFWQKFNSNLKKLYLSQSGNRIKYMKPTERFIKKYYQIRNIYLYKRIFYTLKDTMIVFIGIVKIQLLRFGCQLRVVNF